ncbi:uncharacterized protein LOC126902845 isoform X2 [Daktulosphaira vitifoliae]|uniref:uncharacterized protein LOC126902845 isoform X2 n=1 Tax=Daktulosphaira vitifoliae TaxID=58002 RepID=UPI0021A9DAF7|nr:uncharacterized protein LOC126902845 isoform X2 [Daktulosphaira vitifoliae]
MNYYSKIHIILLEIIISNVIIVYTNNEFKQNIENQTSITINDLNILIREYPAFIQLKLQKQEYYTGKDIARCPMPYNENTILDDPDVVSSELFNPRECEKPWTWTRQNEIEVPVPINGTVGKRLGDIIRPCLKNNTNIIQCYTHYLNVIESVGLTLLDRYCLFQIEFLRRLSAMDENIDFIEKYSLFNIQFNYPVITSILGNIEQLLNNIRVAFTSYHISTLPFDCATNFSDKTKKSGPFSQEKSIHILKCRELIISKTNYAILKNDQYWKWDITSDNKPDDTVLLTTQNDNTKLGLNLFPHDKPE